ncbi:DMT family transporter [Paenibacillus sp. P25]|nr:DMT family transporter [Paenibacillus sp. P25]
MTNSTQRFPIPLWLLLLVGIIAISFSAIFVRWSDAPVAVIAMYRLGLTTLLMLPFLWKRRHAIRLISRRDWLLLITSGTMLGLHFLFWMASLRFTTVANSTAILTLEPIFVLFGACLFLKQSMRPLALAGMLTAIVGAALIGWSDWALSGEAWIGDGLSLLGAVTVAVHMLLGKSLRTNLSAFIYSFFVFLSATFVLALYNLVTGARFTGYPPKEWGIFLLLAVVPTLFGHYLFNWSLKYMRPESVSMSVLGEPPGAALLAYLLLGEALTWLQAAAGAILLLGVWLFLQSGDEKNASKTATVDTAEVSESA